MSTTPGHFTDQDCIAAGGVTEDADCSICGVSAEDVPCVYCSAWRYHRQNCPASDTPSDLGGCGCCVMGMALTLNGDGDVTIQACDECARYGHGFADGRASDDDFAQRFAYHAVTVLADLRDIIWPDANVDVRPVGEATVERIAQRLATFKPRKSEQAGV